MYTSLWNVKEVKCIQVCGMWKRLNVCKFVECVRGEMYTSLWNVVEVKCIQVCGMMW